MASRRNTPRSTDTTDLVNDPSSPDDSEEPETMAESEEYYDDNGTEPTEDISTILPGTFDPLEWDLEGAVEPVVMPAGSEVRLRIVSVLVAKNKHGDPYISPRFEVVDEPYAKEFTKYYSLPNSKQTPKQSNACRNDLKKLFQWASLDTSTPINFKEDLIGCEGWAILGQSSDEKYGLQNTVESFS